MHPGRIALLLGLGSAMLLSAPLAAAADDDSGSDKSDSDKSGSDKADSDKSESKDDQSEDKSEQSQPPSAAEAQARDDAERYAYLNRELKRVEVPTERWINGWTTGFAAIALSQYAFAASAPNEGLKEFSIVGAINATLGFGAMAIAPNTLFGTREHLQDFDASTTLGVYERRRRAEYLLQATAAEEKFYHSPIPILLATATSGAGAAILIAGYNQVLGGIATFGAGVGLTALQMLTRPWAATKAWERYVNKYHPVPGSQVPPDQVQMFLSFAVTPTSASVRLDF